MNAQTDLRIAEPTSGPDAAELEAAARLLEGHPDFRVLRRLVVREAFGVEPEGAPAVGAIVDVESTGTDVREDRLVELTVLRFEHCAASGRVCRVTDVYSGLEDPGRSIPPGATAVHGITDTMVRGRRLDDDRVAALLSGVSLVIAHNAAFDRALLEARLPVFARKAWACSWTQVPWSDEGFPGAKLEYLAHGCGFFYDAHRSELDCRALLEVLARPLPQSGRTALACLVEQSQTPALVLWATGSPYESKDALRARGYRWDPERRCWHRRLTRAALEDECAWLKESVYGGRAAQVEIEILDAFVRFSRRPGARKTRVV